MEKLPYRVTWVVVASRPQGCAELGVVQRIEVL